MKSLKLIVILLLLVSSSCKRETGDFAWYKYAQTGCADKWEAGTNNTDAELSDAVKVYLKAQSISINKIQVGFDASLVQGCMACFCHTGKFIQVYTSTDYETKLFEIGFNKVENP